MNSDVTILIQGPIRNNLLIESIPFYQKYGEVLFVHYDYENIYHIENTGIKFLKINLPTINSEIFNFNNTFLQTNGILMGLKNIKTKYTIRVRSDESFPNLDNFLTNIMTHENKIHVTNLYSFKDNEHKFCLGNHIFASKTEIMLKAFEWAYDVCINKNDNIRKTNNILYYKDINNIEIPMWSEILQTISFLIAKKVNIDSKNSKNQIIENFYMTPLRDLPNFKWTHKYNNYQPITSSTIMEYDPNWEDSKSKINRFMIKIEDI
jgi:hypothetical protein